MGIEALKEQARRHEQKEEWQKALDQYKKAIAKLDEDDQPDIGLYNRVGDLYVRVGNLANAVEHYERAVDLYMEAELPNNAIAVLKKVIRNVPERHEAFLKMGQVRASQGFLPDARANFLTYAERMQQAGDMDESFRALVEFCDLAPDDVALRRVVADQMASHDRIDDAVGQLSVAYRNLMLKGESSEAAAVESRIRELNPDADLDAAMAAGVGAPHGRGGEEDAAASFGEIEFGASLSPEAEEEEEEAGGAELGGFEISTAADEAASEAGAEAEEEAAPLPMLGFGDEEEETEEEAEPLPTFGLEEEGEGEEAASLPTFGFGDEEETSEEDATPLPTFGLDDEEEAEEAEPLPTFDLEDETAGKEPETVLDAAAFGEADHGEREAQDYVELGQEMVEVDLGLSDDVGEGAKAVEAAMEEARAESEEAPASLDEVRARIASSPEDVSLHQRFVELAYQAGDESVLADAYMGLGGALQKGGQAARAKAAFQQVLQLQPDNAQARAALGGAPAPSQPVKEVASHEDYVDLGSMILGDESEKTTRFVVAYEEPSGDEAADFAKMLSQFKEKVSQNLDADDVKAHSDLGTAYKEMGLLDEAVSEFQQALRTSQTHLPTYELLGQTFMEMGRFDAAVRTLERALEVPFEIEDELLGIYYYLARAYEAVGNTKSALEFYDRVFSLDINFADVTERLRALR